MFLHLSYEFSSQKVLIIKTLCKFAAKSVSLTKRSTDFFFSHENIYFTLSGYYYPFDTYLFPIS